MAKIPCSSSKKDGIEDETGKTGNASSKTGGIKAECLHRSKLWTGTGENGRKCLYGSRKWTGTSTQGQVKKLLRLPRRRSQGFLAGFEG